MTNFTWLPARSGARLIQVKYRASVAGENYFRALLALEWSRIYGESFSQMKPFELLDEAQQLFRAIFESAPVAILMVDCTGSIELANAEAIRLFGYGPAELPGLHIENLIPERFRASHPGYRTHYFATPTTRPMGAGLDLHARRKDGSEFPVEIGLSSATIGGGVFAVCTIIDIGERAKHAAALRTSNEALARSNAELKRFAYAASHDLQTPLRSISGFVELLQSTYAEILDVRATDWIRRTRDSAVYLQALVRNLLEYTRIDAQPGPFERISLGDVVEQVIALLDTTVREAQAEITSGGLPVIMGDRSQLVELMQNLVGNAIKYRGAELPRVHISAVHKGDEWVVAVRDNGIGIAPKYHLKIFEVFQRLHGRKEYAGSGIGLALCRRVVEHHGGSIWVESEPDKGSVFYFSLPEEKASPNERKTRSQQAGGNPFGRGRRQRLGTRAHWVRAVSPAGQSALRARRRGMHGFPAQGG